MPIHRVMERIAEDRFRALLAWVERERALERLMERGKIAPLEFELRRVTSLDRLIRETARAA